jgi:hypothetical protein
MSVTTLKHVSLEGRPASGRTRHTLNGVEIEPAASLRILQYAEDPGFYLMHFDASGREIADTYHDSIEQAMEQAEWEYNVKPAEWRSWDN